MRKLQMDELNRLSKEDFQNSEKLPFVIILDNVRSMHNVGSAFRTADAFKAEKIFLCGITATPPHRDIHKTALGATETVPWEYAGKITELLTVLKTDGWKIIALEQTTESITLQDFVPEPETRYAFIFGNEVFGVQEEAISQSHLCLEIPQYGTKHSLNVSVSIGIIGWHFVLHTIQKNQAGTNQK